MERIGGVWTAHGKNARIGGKKKKKQLYGYVLAEGEFKTGFLCTDCAQKGQEE